MNEVMTMLKQTQIFFASLWVASVSSTANQKPNLVIFISDDLGRLDTSIHGSNDVRTPTMDLLAAGGMTFDDAYVASPSCCPSRFSLLTGLMPARHGAHPNHSQVKPGHQVSNAHTQEHGLPYRFLRQSSSRQPGLRGHGLQQFPNERACPWRWKSISARPISTVPSACWSGIGGRTSNGPRK